MALSGLTVGLAGASADVPSASSTCAAVSWQASNYQTQPGTPAVTRQIVDKPGQPYIAPTYKTVVVTPEVPAKDAVYEVLYEFVQHETGNIKWQSDPNWNAQFNPNSKGWSATGNTMKGDLVTAAIPARPAVTEQQLTDPGQPKIDPTYKTEVVTPGTDGNDRPNLVIVTVDGVPVASSAFGASTSGSYDYVDKTVAHSYSIAVEAWNDPSGNMGLTTIVSGTSTPCAQDVVVRNVPEADPAPPAVDAPAVVDPPATKSDPAPSAAPASPADSQPAADAIPVAGPISVIDPEPAADPVPVADPQPATSRTLLAVTAAPTAKSSIAPPATAVKSLAYTGADVLPLALLAAGLLGAGGILLLAARGHKRTT